MARLNENLINETYPKHTVNFPAGTTDADLGKLVVLDTSAGSQYALAADGDQLEGTIFSVDNVYANDEVEGSVTRQPMMYVRCRVSSATVATVGAVVVCAAQEVAGTAGLPRVRVDTANPTTGNGRVVDLLGTNGAEGTTVLIEKFN